MPVPTATNKTDSKNSFEIAVRFALRKFAERQRVLNEEFKILERDVDATLTILKKKKVKKFIDTLTI